MPPPTGSRRPGCDRGYMLRLLLVASLCCGCFLVVERWGNGALCSDSGRMAMAGAAKKAGHVPLQEAGYYGRGGTGGGRRLLSGGPGSHPPRCTSKCGSCSPCAPVHVSVPPGVLVTTEYYPVAWRCNASTCPDAPTNYNTSSKQGARAPAGKKKARRSAGHRAGPTTYYFLAVPGDSDRHGGDGLTPGRTWWATVADAGPGRPACVAVDGAAAVHCPLEYVVRAAEPAGALRRGGGAVRENQLPQAPPLGMIFFFFFFLTSHDSRACY